MHFFVAPAAMEHPDHPGSAMIIHATTSSNKTIDVSVPVDGQVMYNVNGYPMSTEAAIGGGRAAVCDQAEQLLQEMQQQLQATFGIQAGEIWWESKDPNRALRVKKDFPMGRGQAAPRQR